jgi:hypothetical protein
MNDITDEIHNLEDILCTSLEQKAFNLIPQTFSGSHSTKFLPRMHQQNSGEQIFFIVWFDPEMKSGFKQNSMG